MLSPRHAVLTMVIVLLVKSAAAEERTVTAHSLWEGREQLYTSGPECATFVGAFSGIVFIEDEGSIARGKPSIRSYRRVMLIGQ